MKKQQIVEIVKEVVGNSLAQSIYGLVKSNNGLFKSDAQANFLKSQLDRSSGVFGSGSAYGNSYTDFAEYDDKGIVRITRKAFKTGKESTFWERKVQGKLTPADEKAVRYYNKEIKKLEQSIARRQAAKAEFEEKGLMNLYREREQAELDRLNGFKQALNKTTNS